MSTPDFSDAYTPREAARVLRCSVRSVYRLCWANELEYIRVGRGRGRLMITPEAVQTYWESRRVPTQPSTPNGKTA